METRELTCIGCPMGCQITVKLDQGEVASVEGNTCNVGDRYARKEVTNPTRVVTSTVVIHSGDKARLSVKTGSDVPKSSIFEVMKAINAVSCEAPKHIGDVIIQNVCGTGADVIATRNVEKA